MEKRLPTADGRPPTRDRGRARRRPSQHRQV